MVLRDISQKLDPTHTALLLVDLQNDYCDPKGALARRGEDVGPLASALPAIADLTEAARTAGAMVIHILSENNALAESDVSFINILSEECCKSGSWGAEIVPAVRPKGDELVVTKHRVSPFPDSRLELLLRSNHLRSVVVVGAGTEGGIESTVRDAHSKDFYVVVPADCVATPASARDLHDASLKTIARHFGTVVPSARIKDAWTKAAAAA